MNKWDLLIMGIIAGGELLISGCNMGIQGDQYVIEEAKKRMEFSPFYQKVREISNRIPKQQKKSEIRLEIGSYSWGGYEVVNIIEKEDKIIIIYYGKEEWREGIMPKEEYIALWRLLEKNKVWNLKSDITTASSIKDAATYFLSITKGDKKKDLVVYGAYGSSFWWSVSLQRYKNIVKSILERGEKYTNIIDEKKNNIR